MAPQFTLYGNVASLTSDRVRLMLADQGFTDYEFVNLDLLRAEHKQPAHIERHPWGRVPVISLEDGTNLYESTSICKYLALKFQFPVVPNPMKASIIEWALFDQAISAEEAYFFPAACKISFQKGRTIWGQETDIAEVETARKEISKHFEVIEGMLKRKGEFMLGENFSLVDILYMPTIQRLINLEEIECVFGDCGGYDKGNVCVKKWWAQCLQRDEARKYVFAMLKPAELKQRMEEGMKEMNKELEGVDAKKNVA